LKPDAKEGDIIKLCKEALEYKFASVCVNASHVKLAYSFLQGTEVRVCTVVGFPLGATTKETKAFEASQAIENGAAEIDMVINIGALKSGKLDAVKEDIREVAGVCKDKALLKVIIETCLLTDEEKVTACLLSMEAGADFVKTSTGFFTGGRSDGATREVIAVMMDAARGRCKIKGSGGIRDREHFFALIDMGIDRMGIGYRSTPVVLGMKAEEARKMREV